MRKTTLAFAALAIIYVAIPATTTTQARAEHVIVKSDGYHHGWRHSQNRADRVLIVKKRGHGQWHHGRGYGYGHRHHHHY